MLQCEIAIAYLAMVNFKLISPFSHILQSLLHVIFMEIHLRRHTLWVYEWRIAFNSSKNTLMLFVRLWDPKAHTNPVIWQQVSWVRTIHWSWSDRAGRGADLDSIF